MAGFNVSVRGNMDAIVANLNSRQRAVVGDATINALNKIAAQVKTKASRSIRDAGYGLKASDIKLALTTIKASDGNLSSACRASGKPIPLIKYGARQVNAGVSVNVLNGRKTINEAFIATMPSGHIGVFVRVGKTHKKVTKNGKTIWSGLPIKELFGPSVPNGLANEAVQTALQQLVLEKFPTILQQQIKRLAS